ncbi:hypothetical protein EJB05_04797 [Eragrostis curvula]|uniref:Uncharacterized protein n=1 Tax=Eragrostis curvula TaxID=38414 RepID=A0A5J9WBD9_9POAL|nr:hypothetical protein EJB05_04797 [Eragrostis curvula]
MGGAMATLSHKEAPPLLTGVKSSMSESSSSSIHSNIFTEFGSSSTLFTSQEFWLEKDPNVVLPVLMASPIILLPPELEEPLGALLVLNFGGADINMREEACFKLLLNIFLHHNNLGMLLLIPLPLATLLLGSNFSLQLWDRRHLNLHAQLWQSLVNWQGNGVHSLEMQCLTFAHFFGTFSTASSTAAITFSTISSSSMSSLPTLIPEQVPVRRYRNDEPSTLRTCSGHLTRVKSTPIGAFLVE